MRSVPCSLGIAALFAVLSYANVHAQSTRAMWVWQTDSIIDNTNGEQSRLFDFCANPPGSSESNQILSNQINTLYFYAHFYLNGDSTQRSHLHQFLKAAHAHALTVHLLDGAPDWATTGQAYGESYVDYFLSFNAESSDSGRFDGLQLDVEPYLNSGWFTQTLWNGFMTLLGDTRAKIAASGQSLKLGVAAPRWYDSDPGTSYLAQLQDSCDYLAIMDYVDNESSLKSDIANEVSNADSKGKFVVAGVETLPVTPTSSTFNEEGWGNLEARLYETVKKYRTHNGFAGTAIHDYTSYARLSKWGSNNADATAPSTVDYRYDANDVNGVFAVHVVDDMSGCLNASASVSGASVRKSVNGLMSSVAGSWNTQTANYLKFSPTNSVDAGGTYKLIYNPKDSAGNQRHDTTTITIAATPTASYPALYAVAISHSPTLRWRTALATSSYRVQVSSNSSFGDIIADQSGLTDTTYALSGLSDTTLYYWRVSASNLSSTSRYSNRMEFTTNLTPGPVVALNSLLPESKNEVSLRTDYTRDSRMLSVDYTLPGSGRTIIDLYNDAGQLVSAILDRDEEMGAHHLSYEFPYAISGTYFLRLRSSNISETRAISVVH